ncbi:Plant UBX domain-containing protein 8 [Dichanthelium oligosanthes]|uniref:Plant UBX domain-containing protein 8 n=1 Tax=Dichanthelium oligosanthes TaxID=888268 RepID=A0A1E5V3X0_9POAL|nr:Plant UBX domain-containing protein 8 [Dichanthelium oligosanthes]
MARPPQEAIDTFVNITGADEALAVRKLEEHGGDLNRAINSHFSEGDSTLNGIDQNTVPASAGDMMDLDAPLDNTFQRSLLPENFRDPFALMDPDFQQQFFDRVGSTGGGSRGPLVSHPREVRDIPIEVKDSDPQTGPSGQAPVIEDVTGNESSHGREVHETIIIDDEDDILSSAPSAPHANIPSNTSSVPTAPPLVHIAFVSFLTSFFSKKWGGISSEEHDEAVMLEAAMFGGVPEGPTYPFTMPSHRSSTYYPPLAHSPSPALTEQRLLREQQDDEYLASLQADQEKELKAVQEAELRRLEETAAREAALEKQKQEEDERRKKQLEEEELESNLAFKQASLPSEPPPDIEGAVNVVVRMPDGSRRGRRFLKTDKLQLLFDFLDIGRTCKPGTYRLVRTYPRRTFTTNEGDVSFSDLGLTSKQEALFLEHITE